MRLQKYLAQAGAASRRGSEALIVAGRVSVNGVVVREMGVKVAPGDEVALDGVSLLPEAHQRYLVLNKPAGYVSTMADEQGRPTASSLIVGKYPERLYNVGRLDMWSEGLLLFTNDGDFARTIAHPATAPEKEYLVETNAPIPADLPARFAHGIRIDGVWYKAEAAALRDPRHLSVTLIEGKNREIRTIFAHYGTIIRRLTRTRIGPVTLGTLAPGESRPLTALEYGGLRGPHNPLRQGQPCT